MKYHSALKMQGILTRAAAWMNLEECDAVTYNQKYFWSSISSWLRAPETLWRTKSDEVSFVITSPYQPHLGF